MKRFLSMMLFTALCLSFAACAAPQTPVSGTDSDSATDTAGLFDPVGSESSAVQSDGSAKPSSEVSTDSASASTDSVTDSNPDSGTSTKTNEKITISTVTAPGGENSSSDSNDPPSDPIPNKLMAITDQKNDEIVVVNLDKDITSKDAIVWRWSTKTKGDVPHANLCRNRLDDVRLRDCEAWGGLVVGLTSSSGMVALVRYPSGECLFSANMAGYGPHSIEILPNGVIAVVGSGNGDDTKSVLRLYSAVHKSDPNFVEVPLQSGHGVLWDPEEELLWALGGKELNAYYVGGTRQKPTLTFAKKANVNFTGGHDLSPVYGSSDLLWVTYTGGVGQYSKSRDRFLATYEGKVAISVSNTKSINTYEDGVTVLTVADKNNKTASHNTDKVRIFRYVQNSSGSWQYRFTDVSFNGVRDFYKVRAFVADYQ